VGAIQTLAALCVATILLSACGESTPGGTSAGSTVTPTGDAATSPPTSQTAAGELPMFMQEFDRVCETQVGFGGAAAHNAAAPGIHPVVLFYDSGDPPTLITASVTLPAGWAITEDTNFDDNTELAAAELIACSRRTAATPNGTMCDFTLNDGGTVTLELTDTVYELTLYAATSGEQVGQPKTLEASDTECPMFASFKEGDTRYLNTPTEDQYVTALKEFVAP
jgi:hypothetical protein